MKRFPFHLIFYVRSLIQAQGLTILTDPVFSIQPLQSIFAPKRLRPMPCSITAVLQGRVDVVLLSHNHFDHIDLSILKLFPKYVKWFVPLGVKKLLKVTGLPALHWTGRLTPIDTNTTL